MNRQAWLALGAAAFFVFLLPTCAPARNVEVFQLRGIPSGGRLQLTLTPGPPATKAVRVYSEPSHTLLLLVVDPDFRKSREGKAWLEKNAKAAPKATVTTELPSGRPSVEVPPLPAGDEKVAVWVFGSWPDGREEDRKFESGKLDPAGFVLSVELTGQS
jgi:hypothetical protein